MHDCLLLMLRIKCYQNCDENFTVLASDHLLEPVISEFLVPLWPASTCWNKYLKWSRFIPWDDALGHPELGTSVPCPPHTTGRVSSSAPRLTRQCRYPDDKKLYTKKHD